jgi:hypothetical protein
MTAFKVEIKVLDKAAPAIQRSVARASLKRVQQAVGPRLVRFVGSYVAGLGPNKMHWPTTRFYPRAARATTWAPLRDGVVIRINQVGMRQRFYGGPISPVNARALTIPVSPESYGHRASEFPGLFLIRTRNGAYLVQLPTRTVSSTPRSVKVSRGAGLSSARRLAPLNFLFRLSTGVKQIGDPKVLPREEALRKEAMDALNDAIKN